MEQSSAGVLHIDGAVGETPGNWLTSLGFLPLSLLLLVRSDDRRGGVALVLVALVLVALLLLSL